MFAQNVHFVAHVGEVAPTNVTAVAPLRDHFQGDFLTTAREPQWRMRLLHAFRLVNRLVDRIIFPGERRIVLGPHAMNNLRSFAETRHALFGIGITVAIGAILVLVPASTEAEDKATMRHDVESRANLRHQSWIAVAITGTHLS